VVVVVCFFFSSRRRHTRLVSDWSSDVCSSDLLRSRSRAWRRGWRACARNWSRRRTGPIRCGGGWFPKPGGGGGPGPAGEWVGPENGRGGWWEKEESGGGGGEMQRKKRDGVERA